MSPHGLGRGLSALISGADQTDAMSPATRATLLVPTERIHPNPFQPRRVFSSGELEQLVTSIRQYGILQPLVVSVRPDGAYELIVGERRFRAAQRAGLAAVPVVVRDGAMDDRTKLELALIENVQRQDLNPIERALAYRQLQEGFGLTQEEVATRVGISRSAVAHTVRFLSLPSDIQDAIIKGDLSEGHAKVLAGITDSREQRVWFDRIIARRLPVTALAAARGRTRAPGVRSGASPSDAVNLRAKALALQQRLGARVRIASGVDGGGTITIDYSNLEELQGILRAILRP